MASCCANRSQCDKEPIEVLYYTFIYALKKLRKESIVPFDRLRVNSFDRLRLNSFDRLRVNYGNNEEISFAVDPTKKIYMK